MNESDTRRAVCDLWERVNARIREMDMADRLNAAAHANPAAFAEFARRAVTRPLAPAGANGLEVETTVTEMLRFIDDHTPCALCGRVGPT